MQFTSDWFNDHEPYAFAAKGGGSTNPQQIEPECTEGSFNPQIAKCESTPECPSGTTFVGSSYYHHI